MKVAIANTSRLGRSPAVLPPQWNNLAGGPGSIVATLLATLTGWTLAVLGAPLPQTHGETFSSSPYWVEAPPPPGGLRADDLLCSLSSPLDASTFLSRHARRIRHKNPIVYTSRFRMSFEEFQRYGWRGDCNDFANSICEAGHRHGYPMGLVSMWPLHPRDRLRKDWHQVAVLCLQPDREYIVFEYEVPIHWHGTLEDYARSIGKTILPVGGVLEWRPTKPNLLARFLDHLRWNTRLRVNERPLRPMPSPPVA